MTAKIYNFADFLKEVKAVETEESALDNDESLLALVEEVVRGSEDITEEQAKIFLRWTKETMLNSMMLKMLFNKKIVVHFDEQNRLVFNSN